jgi:hypothetical protein
MTITPVVVTPVTSKYKAIQFDGTNAQDIVTYLDDYALSVGIVEDSGALLVPIRMTSGNINQENNAGGVTVLVSVPVNYYLCVPVWGSAPSYGWEYTYPFFVVDNLSQLVEL